MNPGRASDISMRFFISTCFQSELQPARAASPRVSVHFEEEETQGSLSVERDGRRRGGGAEGDIWKEMRSCKFSSWGNMTMTARRVVQSDADY